ncbi:hypothetical protein [Actinopolymorpha alba]|uniref:hypothetical protein n=1 Tax=Actinopolymorpha alba TaxID=533267 RepID=UPI0003677B80|nr:hypothetical protein [Actinopolymorpha alba]
MRRLFAVALVTGTLSLVVAACGGSPHAGAPVASARTPSSGSTPTNSPTSKGVDPNAPESNPAGDIPDDTVFVPFKAGSARWQVSVPQGWARTKVGAAVVFTDKLNSVRVEEKRVATAPTVKSAQATDIPAIQASESTVKIQTVGVTRRNAGQAVRITYTANSDPDPVTGKVVKDAVERYAFFHRGTEVILTLSGPDGADNVDPWRTVSDSLRWLP